MKKFAELFKKYRLRAEFETFSSFGNALGEKGYFYEESIFSHWQKGTRVPTNRLLILKILEIFIERDAIDTIEETNEFLSSVGLGYVTDKERKSLGLDKKIDSPFQVPHEIAHFAGREEVVKKIQKENIHGKTILLYGPAGVGKTTLAIKLGHMLRQHFPDGVLWYRIDMVKIEDIFVSIAHLLGEELPKSKNREILASFIRSLLARKKVLLLFDNVEKESDIHLFLPLGSSSSLIISSRHKDLYLPTSVTAVSLESFSEEEVLGLFKNIFDKAYVRLNKKTLLRLGTIVGNLPLAVHVLASQLKQLEISPESLFEQGEKKAVYLRNLSYENKNLSLALEVSYSNLSEKARAVFLSLGVFEGKDFSADAIGYMNGLSSIEAREVLDELHNNSLIEISLNKKFRMHPIVKMFVAEKLDNPQLLGFIKIAVFFFVIFTIYWIFIQILYAKQSYNSFIFSATYFIVALYGGLWGISIAQKWGGLKSIIGKSIFFFSMGLFSQSIGQIMYCLYDIIFHIQAAYPSLGDIGYFMTIPFYIYATFLMAKASGIKMEYNFLKKKLKEIIILIFILISGYIILLQHYIFNWSNPLKIFLDFAYPFGDMISLSFAILTYSQVKNEKKSIQNKILLISIALFMQFLSDYVFIYQKNAQTWYIGNMNDYMYFFAYLLMTLSIIRVNLGISKIIIR